MVIDRQTPSTKKKKTIKFMNSIIIKLYVGTFHIHCCHKNIIKVMKKMIIFWWKVKTSLRRIYNQFSFSLHIFFFVVTWYFLIKKNIKFLWRFFYTRDHKSREKIFRPKTENWKILSPWSRTDDNTLTQKTTFSDNLFSIIIIIFLSP